MDSDNATKILSGYSSISKVIALQYFCSTNKTKYTQKNVIHSHQITSYEVCKGTKL